MPPTKPDTVIEAMVRKAYMELIARANGRIPPEQVKLLQDDIEKVWFPREQTAFVASMDVVSFIQRVIESQKIGISTVKDREFAAALLFEYLALAEGIFKFQLCHIAILASFAGYDVKIRGRVSPKSHRDLISGDVFVEDLAAVARLTGFKEVIDRVFSNPIRRAIAHMDVGLHLPGAVTFFDTDKKGVRTPLGPPKDIPKLQKMNYELRDFCHSFSNALASYISGQFRLGPAG